MQAVQETPHFERFLELLQRPSSLSPFPLRNPPKSITPVHFFLRRVTLIVLFADSHIVSDSAFSSTLTRTTTHTTQSSPLTEVAQIVSKNRSAILFFLRFMTIFNSSIFPFSPLTTCIDSITTISRSFILPGYYLCLRIVSSLVSLSRFLRDVCPALLHDHVLDLRTLARFPQYRSTLLSPIYIRFAFLSDLNKLITEN